MKQLHLVSLSIWLTTAASTLGRAQQAHNDTTAGAKIQAAEGAARRWLALVDATAYEASWDSAAAMFRHQITREGWQDAVIAARLQVDPLGARRQVVPSTRVNCPMCHPASMCYSSSRQQRATRRALARRSS